MSATTAISYKTILPTTLGAGARSVATVANSHKNILPGTYDAGATDVMKDAQRLALLVLAVSILGSLFAL